MPPAIEKKPTAAIPSAVATVVYVVLGWSGVENNPSCLRLYPFYLVTVVIEKNQPMPYLRQRLRWSTWCWDGPVLRIGSRGVSIWWRLVRPRQKPAWRLGFSRIVRRNYSFSSGIKPVKRYKKLISDIFPRNPVRESFVLELLVSSYYCLFAEVASFTDLSRSVEGYSIYIKGFPMDATHALLEEEFKKFGPIKHNGIQVRNNRDIDQSFGFDNAVEEIQSAIDATNVEEKSNENCIGLKVLTRILLLKSLKTDYDKNASRNKRQNDGLRLSQDIKLSRTSRLRLNTVSLSLKRDYTPPTSEKLTAFVEKVRFVSATISLALNDENSPSPPPAVPVLPEKSSMVFKFLVTLSWEVYMEVVVKDILDAFPTFFVL
ncbi:hypothetical protein E3N88_30558 [Mikania micrantha]|uniref:RRM domain-containing protein n=1 Tax=Mikania micrantha TaxID=192012 RepID=A0A5N6MPY4_9ASTR|nr:hypothetical protein E3N88_30558 [Mikania micrantha]